MEVFEQIVSTLLLYGGIFYFAHLNTLFYRKLTTFSICIPKNSKLLKFFKRKRILIFGIIFYAVGILYVIFSFLLLTVIPDKTINPIFIFDSTHIFIDTQNKLLLWKIGITYLSVEIAFYMINTYKKKRPPFSHKSWLLAAVFILVYGLYLAWIII